MEIILSQYAPEALRTDREAYDTASIELAFFLMGEAEGLSYVQALTNAEEAIERYVKGVSA